MAAHYEVLHLSNRFVTETYIQLSRARVERRHAEKRVWRHTENHVFGELDQTSTEAQSAAILAHSDGLNVAGERTPHAENEKPHDLPVARRRVDIASRIGDQLERRRICPLKSEPRLGRAHDP